jgi:hypothetical protein
VIAVVGALAILVPGSTAWAAQLRACLLFDDHGQTWTLALT